MAGQLLEEDFRIVMNMTKLKHVWQMMYRQHSEHRVRK